VDAASWGEQLEAAVARSDDWHRRREWLAQYYHERGRLLCGECGARSPAGARGWRAVIDEAGPDVTVLCPGCSATAPR
jgi:hypothetical protein